MKANMSQQAAHEVGDMTKKAVKDTAVAAKIAKKAASGDTAGAIFTAASNPMTVIRGVVVAIALLFVILTFVGTFAAALPFSAINSVAAASINGYDALVLGWEEWKATLGNSVDDLFNYLVSGETNEENVTFLTEVATAQDPKFSAYVGTINSLVAVLNNYFRDAYEKLKEQSYPAAAEAALNRRNEQIASGIQERHITEEIKWIANDSDYVDWTFYLIASDSVSNVTAEKVDFRAAPMLAAAKDLINKRSLWNVEITSTVTEGTIVEEELQAKWVDVKRMVPIIDPKTGEEMTDENGEVIYEETIVKELQWVSVPVSYPTRHISVEYKATPRTEAKDYITGYFGLTEEKQDETDVSEVTLVEENVLALRRLYSNAAGDLLASGSIKKMIQEFYLNHADMIFAGPASVSGPMPEWRKFITSHMGATDIPEHASGHGGTDVSAPNYTPCTLSSPAIVVAVTNIYPNVNDYSYAGGRGNFVLLYFGEQSGGIQDEQKGIFVLYQHLGSANVTPGQLLPAGTTDLIQSGNSGKSTGPHWHIETYVGYSRVDPEFFLM